ncbi:hypothetical protein V2G26_007049 [Clonostachys chloroleuca]
MGSGEVLITGNVYCDVFVDVYTIRKPFESAGISSVNRSTVAVSTFFAIEDDHTLALSMIVPLNELQGEAN